jgi:hypothetical protein
MPARIMSLWLTISASAGASFRVPMKKRDAFIQIFQKRRALRSRCGAGASETRVNDGNGRRHCKEEDFAVFRVAWQSALHPARETCPEFGFVPVRGVR